MTFDELFARVCDALQREQRISYRALRRRFELSDGDLEDLKIEIIEAKRLAVDENERILVWACATEGKPESVILSDQTEPQPMVPQERPPQVEPPPTEPRTLEAERRQLTVMFCDLVDSTQLSSQLDPEDYREVVRAYQSTCTEVIHRFDGYIAQYLGNGLLVYFGYPQSHEDDAQRAVWASLGILNTLKQLKARLESDSAIRLALRIGIHTGLVVIGDIGTGAKQEQLALGETPNVAARIQGLAAPDTVVLSASTHRLVQGYFAFQVLGEQNLRGVSEPMAVYRVLGETGTRSRIDIAATRGLTPLVGREQEVGLLLERWQQAKEGQGQVILLSGEAGIGKSRLVRVLREHVTDEPHTRWECRSSPYYTNTAFYPMTDFLQRTLRFQADDMPEQRLKKLEEEFSQYHLPLEESIPLFAPLLSLPIPENTYPPLHLSPQQQRQKTLESIVAIMLELSERKPMLFIVEDLHWTDPTTLEWIDLLIDQTPRAALYILLTCRPQFQPSWRHRSFVTEVTVNRLSPHQIKRLAVDVTGGKALPEPMLEQIVEKTDGVPFRELSRLVEAELLYQRGRPPLATYTFKHALIQDAAYASLLKRTRQQYHQRIAHLLEIQFHETIDTQPEVLAHHFTEAGLNEQAVGYGYRAGQKAVQHSENMEAIAHLNKGLALVHTFPDPAARLPHELRLLTMLAPALRNTKGQTAPELEQTYTRAYAISQHVEDAPESFPVLRGLWNLYLVRGQLQTASELGEELFRFARREQDPTHLLWSYCVLGMNAYYLGDLVSARAQFEYALGLYDPKRHRSLVYLYGIDPAIAALTFLAWLWWMLGYAHHALEKSQEALALAQTLSHPWCLAFCLQSNARLHQFRFETQSVQEQAERCLDIATEQRVALFKATGAIMQGWAFTMQGRHQDGAEQIRQGLNSFRTMGARLWRSYYLALDAEVYSALGQYAEGLRTLAEALAAIDETGERFYEAEIHRLKGELLLQQSLDNTAEAESCFQQAISIAQSQSAKSLELRAATSLARLWQSQGKHQDAYELLAPVYNWFTEGFDTADIIDAKALLGDLEGRQT